jgi:hypothetical protein
MSASSALKNKSGSAQSGWFQRGACGEDSNVNDVDQDPLTGSIVYDAENERYVLWYATCSRLMDANRRFDGVHGHQQRRSTLGKAGAASDLLERLVWE